MSDEPDDHVAWSEHQGDQMLTLAEVAELLRVPQATMRYWRHLGTGPRSFRIGRSVRYWRTEVWTWIDTQTNSGNTPATSQPSSMRPASRTPRGVRP